MFDPTTMVGFHTWLSLIAIAVGILVMRGLLSGHEAPHWTGAFLVTAILTSVTGYFLPASTILPSHIVGAIALLVLAAVLYARYVHHLSGVWRGVYAGGLVASEYFLVFVAVAQIFQKVPAARQLAPTGSEPPFAIVQGIVLLVFIVLGYLAVRGNRRTPVMHA